MRELAEQVAKAADDLGIATALIGAAALAAHDYVRGTADVDLASHVDPFRDLRRLQLELDLGGLLRVWRAEDEDGDPIDPVDIVNLSSFERRSSESVEALRMPIRKRTPSPTRKPKMLAAMREVRCGGRSLRSRRTPLRCSCRSSRP